MSHADFSIQQRDGRLQSTSLATDVAVASLAQQLRDALGLPIRGASGNEFEYALFNTATGRFLYPEQTLAAQEIKAGTRLRILPRLTQPHNEIELLTDPNPGMRYPVPPQETSIGREFFGNDIVIRHKVVSRKHGVFQWIDGFHVYLDLGSANGSWINDQLVTELTPVAVGDVITLGRTVQLIYQERASELDSERELDEELAKINMDDSATNLISTRTRHIYLSHSPAQGAIADALVGALRATRIAVHRHTDAEDMFDEAEVMLLLVSPESVQSAHVESEWFYFFEQRRPILPIIFDGSLLPTELQSTSHQIVYTGNEHQLLNDVLNALADLME